jgi:hypothetical protein
MPDETIDEWFNYMANTDSGTTVNVLFGSILRLFTCKYRVG